MFEARGPSRAQRWTLASFAALWVAMVWWLLFAGGLADSGYWFGLTWHAGSRLRSACLAGALSIYFVRILFTEFVFLQRGVKWIEVGMIVPWILCICVLLAIAGGTNAASPGPAFAFGLTIFAVGSWMNTYSEYQRHVWRRHPEHRGQLYTAGLFRYSRHPNYLGDLVSFSGLCLIAGAWVTAIIPVTMLAGFVFGNVPKLDAHLRSRHGAAFDEYARRTSKLIPYLY